MRVRHFYIQICVTQALASLLALAAVVQAQTTKQMEPRHYEEQLSLESHQLLISAIQRPYGWGCAAPAADQPEPPRNIRQPAVAMGQLESPAAGLLLLWAGEFLNDSVLRDAAVQFARGASASQERSGMVLDRPLFGANAGAPGAPVYIPDRGSTISALALWLTLLQEDAAQPPSRASDAQIRSAAARAVTWLQKQQARNGAWPSAHPPGADAKNAIRIMRLDDPNYRDATLSLLLASDIRGDKNTLAAARRAIDLLVRMRLTYPDRSASLWPIACTIEGSPLDSDFRFPAGADLIASQYAVQTLIAAAVMLDEDTYTRAIDDATKALSADRFDDGTWPRFFNPGLEPPPTTQPKRLGATTRSIVEWNAPPSDPGISTLLAATGRLRTVTRDRFKADLTEYFTPRQHLAAAMAGVVDDPLIMLLPPDADSAQRYLDSHAADLKLLEGPAPTDLKVRVRRLWLLLVRAKIERRFGI